MTVSKKEKTFSIKPNQDRLTKREKQVDDAIKEKYKSKSKKLDSKLRK